MWKTGGEFREDGERREIGGNSRAVSPWSASREVLRLLVSPWIVGTGKLSGRELMDVTPDSLAWSKSKLCKEMGDDWVGLAVSVVHDSVRQDNSLQVSLLTPDRRCH